MPNPSIPEKRRCGADAVIEPEPPVGWAQKVAPHIIETIGAKCGRERLEPDTDTLSDRRRRNRAPRELVRQRVDQVQERQRVEHERVAPGKSVPVDLAAEPRRVSLDVGDPDLSEQCASLGEVTAEMVEHVLVVERVCALAEKRKLPQPGDVLRGQRPETIGTQGIAVNLELDGMPFDVFRCGRQVMVPDQAPNGRPHGSRESELGEQCLCASREPRIDQQIDIAHRSQSDGRVEHMGERGALEDDGLDSGSVEGIENFTEYPGVDVVAATMANRQSEELPSSGGGKLDTGTTEVLMKEGGKSMSLALTCQVAPILDAARERAQNERILIVADDPRAAGQQCGERRIRHGPEHVIVTSTSSASY